VFARNFRRARVFWKRPPRRMRPLSLLPLTAVLLAATPAAAAESSLRFFGNGVAAPTLDRVVVPLDAPARPIDVGAGDFTIELFLKAPLGSNGSTVACTAANDAWIFGNIVVDRDIFGPGDFGDFGLSLMRGKAAFGVADASSGATACGATDLRDGAWHHLALTRRESDGLVQVYLDGFLDGQAAGPAGNLSYRDGRSGETWDPYLVFGAEKHDAGAEFPSFSGWLDEVRVSTVRRYTAAFVPPSWPFATDPATAALYHFDEGSGTVALDSSGVSGGPSHGERRVGGSPAGPVYSGDSPFAVLFADGFESGSTGGWSLAVP
jgi:hypothetical protein